MAKLLVVDDDALQRQMLGLLLSKHFAVTVCNQFTASDHDWGNFDAVLLDVMMPVQDGPNLVRQAVARCERMPLVVFYSALPAELLQREVAALSGVVAVYYICKAGSPSILIETLLALCAS
jgi:CheY-like chemotaxis protein